MPANVPLLEGMTAREVFTNRTYWLIVAATLLAAVPGNGLMSFIAAMLGERGFEASQTANYLSIFTIAGAIGTIVGGFALDWVQTAKISVPFTLFSIASFVILGSISATHGGLLMLWLAAAFFGFSFGAHRPMGGFFHTRFFGLRSFMTVFAVQSAIMAFLFGIAPPFTGWVRETTGSYDVMIWATVTGLVVSALIYLILGPYRYAKEIGAVPQAASPPPERPIEFATRSET
jgi:predicted MFS family arabinose efflux permease